MIEKICSKCGTLKPLDQYCNHPEKTDGKFSSCKACENKRTKLWRQRNREAALARRRELYRENIDSYKAVQKAWRAKNKHKPRWDVINKDRARENKIKWEAKNPDKVKQFRDKSRAKLKIIHLAGAAVRNARRNGLLIEDKLKCCISNENCEGRIERHHTSYLPEKHLEITYYCRKHHTAWHKVFEAEYLE